MESQPPVKRHKGGLLNLSLGGKVNIPALPPRMYCEIRLPSSDAAVCVCNPSASGPLAALPGRGPAVPGEPRVPLPAPRRARSLRGWWLLSGSIARLPFPGAVLHPPTPSLSFQFFF